MLQDFKAPFAQAKETFNLLGMCCQGHNTRMQNLFREQTVGRVKIDLVDKCCEMLTAQCESTEVALVLAELDVHLIIETLCTLTEFVQGPCDRNQKSVVDRCSEVLTYVTTRAGSAASSFVPYVHTERCFYLFLLSVRARTRAQHNPQVRVLRAQRPEQPPDHVEEQGLGAACIVPRRTPRLYCPSRTCRRRRVCTIIPCAMARAVLTVRWVRVCQLIAQKLDDSALRSADKVVHQRFREVERGYTLSPWHPSSTYSGDHHAPPEPVGAEQRGRGGAVSWSSSNDQDHQEARNASGGGDVELTHPRGPSNPLREPERARAAAAARGKYAGGGDAMWQRLRTLARQDGTEKATQLDELERKRRNVELRIALVCLHTIYTAREEVQHPLVVKHTRREKARINNIVGFACFVGSVQPSTTCDICGLVVVTSLIVIIVGALDLAWAQVCQVEVVRNDDIELVTFPKVQQFVNESVGFSSITFLQCLTFAVMLVAAGVPRAAQ